MPENNENPDVRPAITPIAIIVAAVSNPIAMLTGCKVIRA